MSLLLDALKKAAEDKHKSSQTAGSVAEPAATDSARSEKDKFNGTEETPAVLEELSLQEIDAPQDKIQRSSISDSNLIQELTLENDSGGSDGPHAESGDNAEFVLDEIAAGPDDSQYRDQYSNTDLEQTKKTRNIRADNFTVSDDALSMLIYKTNRDIKRGRKILFASIFIASTAVIVLSGIYYYHDMQTEIAALERKHQIEMLAMQSKTGLERTRDKSAIIQNLVSDADLDEKVEYAKKVEKTKTVSKSASGENRKTVKNGNGADVPTGAMTVRKTNKTDPVGEKLDDAWLQYEKGRYDEAESLYKEVLHIEANNRDALLGLGAIAVIEKNNSKAREIYMSLLKLDPRDPIATAAVASLQSDESSLKADEEYMMAMQQKNPDAPHLNFALGNIYAQQNKWKAAQQYYFNAWQQDNENPDYIYNLAVSMDQLGKSQQAISFYRDSLAKSETKQVSFSREAVAKRVNELSEL